MLRFRRALVASVVLAALGAAGPAVAGSRAPDVVATDKGAVRGTVSENGRAFRRIPFAAPPVGALRWRAPRPAATWTGVRDGTTPGPRCAQEAFPLVAQARSTDEDCLYLNVYTPPGPATNRPVMVYLHGGAFITGSGNEFDGAALARRGTVVVTVNYRLGAFGFLAHPGLSAEDPRAESGNYGLLDQQAALRWVRVNAPAFGGDRSRVTIFGLSAGGESVCAHLTAPASAGLFSRAIVQSGPCHLVTSGLPRVEAAGVSLASHTPCAGQPDVACLRAQPAAAILDAVRATPELAGPSQVWGPTTGTPVLPQAPAAAIAAGTYHKVPVMIGTVLDEGTLLTMVSMSGVTLDANVYAAVLQGWFGADVPRVQALYPLAAYGDNFGATISAIMGDWLVTCPNAELHASLAETTTTYAYELADRTVPNLYAVTPDFPLGAYHASELVFLTRPPALPLSAGQTRLSERMLTYWAAFAATGDPNGGGSPRWSRFTPGQPIVQTLDVDRVSGATDFEARHNCGFWAARKS